MGIYQLYFLKMHSKLLFLSRNAGTKDPAFLSRVLADTLATAKEAMRGRNFAHSPYRTKIITLASGAAAALVHLEQGELEKMREEILTAFSRKKAVSPKADAFSPHRRAAAAARSRSNRKPQKARLRRADALSYGC